MLSPVCPFYVKGYYHPYNVHISAKERAGLGGYEDPKFSGEWRRQGPLPDLASRDSSRRRHEGPQTDRQPPPSSVSETSSDWRSNRSTRPPAPSESEAASRRKNSAFVSESAGAADKEETWTIGSKFKPSEDEGSGRKAGTFKGRGDMGPPSSVPDSPADSDWRSGPRPGFSSRSSTSRESVIFTIGPTIYPRVQQPRPLLRLPSSLAGNWNFCHVLGALLPHHPRLHLLKWPRVPLPVGPVPLVLPGSYLLPALVFRVLIDRSEFRPVDVTAREKVISERLDKEREATKDRVGQHPMSRSNSRQGADRSGGAPRSPSLAQRGLSLPPSPRSTQGPAASIRSTFSFAAAAGKRAESVEDERKVNDISEQLGEVTI